MSVERKAAVCYEVRNEGEWGTFYVREGVRLKDPLIGGEDRHWVELSCHTAFGDVGHSWPNTGGDAQWFLSKLSEDYLLGKLWGAELQVFDLDDALVDAREHIRTARREGSISKDKARELTQRFDPDEIITHEQFQELIYCDSFLTELLWEAGCGKVQNHQATGFWNKLWPEFIKGLNEPVLQGG